MKHVVSTDSGEMRFKGETFICELCGKEYSPIDNAGYEDEDICDVCGSRRFKAYIESLCHFCKKPMGKEDINPFYSGALDEYAHSKCIEKLSDDEIDEGEWNSCWD